MEDDKAAKLRAWERLALGHNGVGRGHGVLELCGGRSYRVLWFEGADAAAAYVLGTWERGGRARVISRIEAARLLKLHSREEGRLPGNVWWQDSTEDAMWAGYASARAFYEKHREEIPGLAPPYQASYYDGLTRMRRKK